MELQYFKDNYQDLPFIFTKAFIGDKDKIIPAYKQKKLFIKKIFLCINYQQDIIYGIK